MAVLYSCEETVEQLSGISFRGTMLTNMQHHDRRHVLPHVLSVDGQDYLLIREIESGNVRGAGFSKLPVVLFAPYFLPKSDPAGRVHRRVADAVEALAPTGTLTVDYATSAAVLNDLRSMRPVEVQRRAPVPVEIFRLTRADVVGAFNHHRPDVVNAANELTKDHPHHDRLAKWFDDKPCDSFALLDKMGAQGGLGALYMSWITNFQELTGLPGTLAENSGYAALYMVGSDEVWVMAPGYRNLMGRAPVRTYGSMGEAVKDIAGNETVGYESDTLFAATLLELEDAGVSTADAGWLLREFREEKAHCDIPYFVLAAMASRYAIDGAIMFADMAIRGGVEITEKDVDRVYLSRISDFAAQLRLPVSLRPYFVNNHSGSRTIYPSRPTGCVLSPGINTLKVDAGIFVFDDGLFHACSDIARTVTTNRAAAEVFDVMEAVMLEETIPNILPGMTGEDIHQMGVSQMGAKDDVFHEHQYMPNDFSWRTSYPRDIGHVIERQESNTFGFKPGERRPVRPGMVGCIEYHCAYDGHAMACEDTFVVDEDGAIVISRGPEEHDSDGRVTRKRSRVKW